MAELERNSLRRKAVQGTNRNLYDYQLAIEISGDSSVESVVRVVALRNLWKREI